LIESCDVIYPALSGYRRRLTSIQLTSSIPIGRQRVSSSITAPEGIINPPIDELLEATDSKYSLVIYAAKRARQINAYYSQLGEGLLEYVGPLVDTHVHEKPLSIALREINAGLLTSEAIEGPAQ
jgi:DNA-directed RNA polymerase subunit omega